MFCVRFRAEMISPGGEEDLVHVHTALLRLLRPFQWQYTHIPLVHAGTGALLRHAIASKTPFLIGTYASVLEVKTIVNQLLLYTIR